MNFFKFIEKKPVVGICNGFRASFNLGFLRMSAGSRTNLRDLLILGQEVTHQK